MDTEFELRLRRFFLGGLVDEAYTRDDMSPKDLDTLKVMIRHTLDLPVVRLSRRGYPGMWNQYREYTMWLSAAADLERLTKIVKPWISTHLLEASQACETQARSVLTYLIRDQGVLVERCAAEMAARFLYDERDQLGALRQLMTLESSLEEARRSLVLRWVDDVLKGLPVSLRARRWRTVVGALLAQDGGGDLAARTDLTIPALEVLESRLLELVEDTSLVVGTNVTLSPPTNVMEDMVSTFYQRRHAKGHSLLVLPLTVATWMQDCYEVDLSFHRVDSDPDLLEAVVELWSPDGVLGKMENLVEASVRTMYLAAV